MSNNRELSQIANLLEVIDSTGHINIKQPAPQNVGIGITAPLTKVHVVGDATVSTNLNVGGNIILGSNLRASGLAVTNHVEVGGATTLSSLTVSGLSNLVGLTSTNNINVTGLTTTQSLAIAGVTTFYNNTRIENDRYHYLGRDNFAYLYAHGSASDNSVTISQGSLSGNGYLRLVGDSINLEAQSGGGIIVRQNSNDVGRSEVVLSYDGNERLRTVGTGVTINGSVGVKTDVHVFGNIGINTNSPTERLHVDGNVYISGTINAGTVTGSISQANYSPVSGIATLAQNLTQFPNISVTSVAATTASVTETLNVGAGGVFLKANTSGVGIKTQTPFADLDVYGNVKIDDGFGNLIVGNQNTGNTLQNPASTGLENILIGKGSGFSINSGNNNTFIGVDAGQSQTGGNNVYLGYRSGYTNTGGSNNICIGYNRSNPIAAGSTQLTIGSNNGDWIYGDSSYNIGIGVTNPISKLDVNGSIVSRNNILSGNLRVDNTSSTSGVTIVTTNSGQLGIGITPANSGKLEVLGNAIFYSTVAVGTTITASAGSFVGGVPQNGGTPNLLVSSGTDQSIPSIIYSNASQGTLQIFSGGLATGSRRGGQIDFVGGDAGSYAGQLLFRTGIGTNGIQQNINARLDTSGVLYATTFTSTSDERKKENIETLSNASEILEGIRGVRFNWKDTGKLSVGVIAQEVEKVLPEAIESDEDGMKSVSYDMLIGVLIETIKEQQKRIDNLEKKINEK